MKKDRLKILFEDKHLIIVYKQHNLSTIKNDNDRDSLYLKVFDYLHKKNQKIFVVHRLDKDTSGVVVFAKSEKTKELLQNNWEKCIRNYYAIVHGNAKEKETIESYIAQTKTLLSYTSDSKHGKYAKTNYETIHKNKQYSLLKINIETGRKNQIRLHMKENNTPILGDRKYGKKDGYRKMMLLAYQIIFNHPITKQEINITLELPEDYKKVVGYNEK